MKRNPIWRIDNGTKTLQGHVLWMSIEGLEWTQETTKSQFGFQNNPAWWATVTGLWQCAGDWYFISQSIALPNLLLFTCCLCLNWLICIAFVCYSCLSICSIDVQSICAIWRLFVKKIRKRFCIAIVHHWCWFCYSREHTDRGSCTKTCTHIVAFLCSGQAYIM